MPNSSFSAILPSPVVRNVWTFEENGGKTKSKQQRRNSQQIAATPAQVNNAPLPVVNPETHPGATNSSGIITSPNHVTTINIANNSSHRSSTNRLAEISLGHEGKYTSASRLALSSMTSLAQLGPTTAYSSDSTPNFANGGSSGNNSNNNSHGNYVDIDQLDQMRFNGGTGSTSSAAVAGVDASKPAAGQSYFPSFIRNYSINQKHPPSTMDISPPAAKLSPRASAMTVMYGEESPIYENQLTIQNLQQRTDSPIYSNTSSNSSVAIQSLNNLHQRSLYDYQTEQNIRNVLNLQHQQQQVNYPVPPVFPQLRYASANSPTNPNASSSSSQSLYSNLPPQSPSFNNVMPSTASLMNVPLYSNVGQPHPGSGMTFGEHFVHNKRHNNFMEGLANATSPTGEATSPQDGDPELPLPPGWSIGEWEWDELVEMMIFN